MPFLNDDSFHNILSFALFSICAGLVAVLVWLLLRRLRRQPVMCDQETMTVEPSVKRGSIVESGMGARRKESGSQIPGPDGTTQRDRKHSAGEGRWQQAASGAPTTTAAAGSAKTSPSGGAERVDEAKAEPRKQSITAATSSPGDSRQTSVITNKSKKRRHSESKKPPGGSSAVDKEDSKGRRSSAPSKTTSKAGSKAGSKPSSRRGSMQHSQASASKAPELAPRKSSSSEVPGVSALLIRRPSTSSKSSQRSSRATRYVGETPKVLTDR
ncbi:uncharacterized protein LOC142766846 [Rhipicephalus microplus]|uniref:uncharacterized protein LOC142766846 n=1 Tax=Rhipicephalus microplus TaxID=6941 RepID=UPI003F6B16B0